MTKLFEYIYSNLYKVAQMYLKNSNDVDDVLKNIYTLDTSMNGYNRLFTIVKNCAKEFNKVESRRFEINCTISDQIEDEFDPLEYILIKGDINTLSDYEKNNGNANIKKINVYKIV